jgi:hypothetical protein
MLEAAIIIVLVSALTGIAVRIGFNVGERKAYIVVANELLEATEQRRRDNATGTPIGEQVARQIGIQP